ncbi:MAG TPA: hypothetical protein VFI28_04900 [Candidatus Limnocylindrales bacterium]|nr:hypothetical protein [Candidatus Limnocylindrales bacterium]
MTDPGIPDFPLAEDPSADERDDASCAIAWTFDDREVLEVYVDPALRDRAESICETVEALAGSHHDIDTLIEAIQTFARHEDLSASVYDEPRDAEPGIVAVAFTLG